jgi:hypothetical protein
MMENKLNGEQLPVNDVRKNDFEPIKWLRSKNVRQMLSISDSTLQTMRISGFIPSYKLGSSWFYREDEIIAALESGRTRKMEVRNV